MLGPFFITGLPRSRTAWLANLFTTDGTLCLHEPKQPVRTLLDGHPRYRIGISDPILPLAFGLLREEFPGAHWLYVVREAAAALASYRKFLEAANWPVPEGRLKDLWEEHTTARAIMQGDHRVRFVPWELLDQVDVMESCWAHLLPEVEFNVARWMMLRELRIEQIAAKAAARML